MEGVFPTEMVLSYLMNGPYEPKKPCKPGQRWADLETYLINGIPNCATYYPTALDASATAAKKAILNQYPQLEKLPRYATASTHLWQAANDRGTSALAAFGTVSNKGSFYDEIAARYGLGETMTLKPALETSLKTGQQPSQVAKRSLRR